MTDGKQRLQGLDIFRIVAALVVMLFHSSIHIGCNYGIFGAFISMGAIFMTGFFMLLGFSLYYVHGENDLSDIGAIKVFFLNDWWEFFRCITLYLFCMSYF